MDRDYSFMQTCTEFGLRVNRQFFFVLLKLRKDLSNFLRIIEEVRGRIYLIFKILFIAFHYMIFCRLLF